MALLHVWVLQKLNCLVSTHLHNSRVLHTFWAIGVGSIFSNPCRCHLVLHAAPLYLLHVGVATRWGRFLEALPRVGLGKVVGAVSARLLLHFKAFCTVAHYSTEPYPKAPVSTQLCYLAWYLLRARASCTL